MGFPATVNIPVSRSSSVLGDVTGTTGTPYNGERLMSVRAVCEKLGISRQSVYRLVADGSLPVVEIYGRRLFRPSDVEALIERSTRTTPS
jgi:excisionase family DNA binding protein